MDNKLTIRTIEEMTGFSLVSVNDEICIFSKDYDFTDKRFSVYASYSFSIWVSCVENENHDFIEHDYATIDFKCQDGTAFCNIDDLCKEYLGVKRALESLGLLVYGFFVTVGKTIKMLEDIERLNTEES